MLWLNAEEEIFKEEVMHEYILENTLLAGLKTKNKIWGLLNNFIKDCVVF